MLVLSLLVVVEIGYSQGVKQDSASVRINSQDTTQNNFTKIRKHSPRKATIFSAVLPGLGQAYNRKYWKIPIIYAGFVFLGKSVYDNNVLYHDFKAAYDHMVLDDGTAAVNEYEEKFDEEKLLRIKRQYRRDRDYMIIISSLWYVLNIVDASVDANLFYWEVDEDLSLELSPQFQNYSCLQKPKVGLTLKLHF
jgi:hypothetical protein